MSDDYMLILARDISICPRCKMDTHADRIPRSWWVKLLFGWLPVRRYMCYKCKRKYYTMDKRDQTTNKSMPMMK